MKVWTLNRALLF